MKTAEIAKIIISDNRQRRQFDPAKLHEFTEGIEKRGLLHPIVVRWSNPVPGEPRKLILVAGERRLRAIANLADLGIQIRCDGGRVPLGCIPYTLLEELDPLAYEEAELEENILRSDLTWQERAAAHARLGKLRAAQATARGEDPPSVADLALEIRGSAEGVNHDMTRKELIVARHLENPEVRAAKNVDEAFKVLKKQETAEKNKALGVSVGATFSAAMHRVVQDDSLTRLRLVASESFDCIITDPPYGMGADEFGDSGGINNSTTHTYKDEKGYSTACYIVLAAEGFRIAKPNAHLYAFCDLDKFHNLKIMFAEAGWTVFRTPLIWYKRHGARAPWPFWGPQRKYETILYAMKGRRNILRSAGDVLDFGPDTQLDHSAQKPVGLYQELLSRTCLPGDTAIDPFCGTGTIFPAAHALKVRAVGIENDATFYGIAVKRIEILAAEET